MFLYKEVILVILLLLNGNIVCLATEIFKYSSLQPGKVTEPAGDVIKSLQVMVEEDCLIQCQESESCTSYEVSYSNGEYSCTLRELFSTDPVNQLDNPGVTSYFLGEFIMDGGHYILQGGKHGKRKSVISN